MQLSSISEKMRAVHAYIMKKKGFKTAISVSTLRNRKIKTLSRKKRIIKNRNLFN